MADIPDDVRDEVERALESDTQNHGRYLANTRGGYGNPISTPTYYARDCACHKCTALARLRKARRK